VLVPTTHAATSTVCTVGCDFTTLYDAVTADAPGPDGILIDAGYFFLHDDENFGDITLPEDTYVTCDPNITLGDGEGSLILRSNNQTTINACHFDGVILRAESVSDVYWKNNTFELPFRSEFHLFDVTNYEITNNENPSHVRMYNADFGTIDNNDFACRYSSDLSLGCVHSTYISIVPYDGSATSTDPIYNSNDVTINGNNFTDPNNENHLFIDFFGGFDVTTTNNYFLRNQIPVNGTTDVRYFDLGGLVLTHNIFDTMLPDDMGAGGATAINILTENQLNALVEHNTIIQRGDNSPTYNACFRIDKYFDVNPSDQVTLSHNICSGSGSILQAGIYSGSGVDTFDNVNFVSQYNVFYNVIDLVYAAGPLTAYPTDLVNVNPFFRLENIDTADDYTPAPMSLILDSGAPSYIGAVDGGARITTYTIDDDCVVDYVTCVSQFTSTIDHVTKSGDSVLIAEGTYPQFSLTNIPSNVSIRGTGPNTIIDAQSAKTGIAITGGDQLQLRDLKIINSTVDTASMLTTTKTIFHYNGNDYDDSDAAGMPLNSVVLTDDSPGCLVGAIENDGDAISVGDGINNINGALVKFGGSYISFLTTSTALTICGGPPIEVLIPNLFIVNGSGGYDYNPTALVTAGVTLKAGMTSPPEIHQSITDSGDAALRLTNVTNSTFENIFFEDNDYGIAFFGSSDSNEVLTSDFSLNNGTYDLVSKGTGNNLLYNSDFQRASSTVSNTGTVTVRYDTDIHVVDSLGADLAGVTVHKVSDNGLEDTTEVSDVNGYTSIVDTLAYILDSSSIEATAGGYNPYTLTADRLGQNATTSIEVAFTEQGTVELMMATVVVVPPSVSLGGGGIPVTSGSPDALLPQEELFPPMDSIRSTEVITSPKVHYLIKLFDDTDPLTQQDTAIYYIGADNKRHPFPNESVFMSWYCNYSQVKTVTPQDMAAYPLGSAITYRPGLRLVKFPNNPMVYVVQPGRVLRRIVDEETAKTLFGADWAKQVTDIDETFYTNYAIGEELTSFVDVERLDVSPRHPSGEMGIEGYKSVMVKPSLYQCK